MSDWTKRDQARVAFLDAAVASMRGFDEVAGGKTADVVRLRAAWNTYRDLIDGKEENLTLDANRWFCPHCGADRPQFTFQLVGTVQIGIGAVQYFNVWCGNESCRKLLSVMLAGYIPDAMMTAEARRQMAALKGGHA